MDDIRSELFGEMSDAQRARQIINQNASMAAAQLVDLAVNGVSERTRLSASGMILDRVLGPVGKDEQQDALQDFIEGIASLARGSASDG
jgi:hypothetical protein